MSEIFSTMFFIAVYFFIGVCLLTAVIAAIQLLIEVWANWIYNFRCYMRGRKI